jgi:soluble lytic murein transglycosylase-like protein
MMLFRRCELKAPSAEAIFKAARPIRQKECGLSGRIPLVSSAMALRARAAAPAPMPARNFAGLMFLCGATLAATGILHQLRQPAPGLPPQQPAMIQAFDNTAIMVPAPPSAFDLESAMPPSQLMKRWEPLILQASKKFKVPAEWIRAVMRQESGGRTMMIGNVPIVSGAGAMGIMQVMPGTYTEMAAQYGLGADPYDPQDNIFAGTAYLRWLHGKYGYPAMFAAYNDGPGNIEDHLYRGRPLPKETRGYIANIAKSLGDKQAVTDLATVKLTQPDGEKVEIDARKVTAVRAVIPGLYAASVQSIVSIGKLNRGVREDLGEAIRLLRSHGAKI